MDILFGSWVKWILSVFYLGLWVALSLAVPWPLGPWLVGIHLCYSVWIYLTQDTRYGRSVPIRPLTPWDVPDYSTFRARLQEACARAGLSREPVWAVLEDAEPNAFAVGGRRGVVVFTGGLLAQLSQEELLAVTGHELHHLASRDAIPAIVGGAWLFLAGNFSAWLRKTGDSLQGFMAFPFLVLSLFLDAIVWIVGWFASVVLARRSRSAEHMADEAGARLTSVAAMCSALERLEEHGQKEWSRGKPARWSMEWLQERLHASHPPTPARVAYLRAERGEA